MRILLVFTLILISTLAVSAEDHQQSSWCLYQWDPNQPPPPRLNLPAWVCVSKPGLTLPRTYKLSTALNPFFITGDFDGDGKTDIAIWIENIKTKERGLAVVHRSTGAVFLLGAGVEMGDRGRDLNWCDMWTLYPRGPVQESYFEDGIPTLKGDAIWLAKSESATVIVYWDGKRYAWFQESD